MAVKPYLITMPKMQFFANDGTVLAGGLVFVYQPGTTTKLNTYPTSADAVAGTNANSNPLILNSAGRPSVDLYTTSSYKMVVAPSTDTDPPASAIWTEDNITSLVPAVSVVAKSANYTVVSTDNNKLISCTTTSASFTVTLLAAATAGSGFYLIVKKSDTSANTVTIQANGVETIDGSNTLTLSYSYDSVILYCDGTQWLKTQQKPDPMIVTTVQTTNIKDINGGVGLIVTTVASGVNGFTLTSGASGTSPTLAASGSGTNLNIILNPKGTGNLTLTTAALTVPLSIVSGTTGQHTTNFTFANTANTRAITFFDADDTVVGRATTDTLTNKTLTSPVLDGTITGTGLVPVRQQVRVESGAVATGTTVIPFDDTIPQITEGDQYMTLAITPKSATSVLEITVTIHLANSQAGVHQLIAGLFQDATANALAVGSMHADSQNVTQCITFKHYMTSGTTSSTTFRVRGGGNAAGTTTFNGNNASREFGGVLASSIFITEWAA